jgi:hypothetical protein
MDAQQWSRRGFLLTTMASGLLVACGSSGGASKSAASSPAPPAGSAAGGGKYTLVQRYPPATQVPGPLRLPLSLSTADAQLIQDPPATLGAQVVDLDGKAIGGRIQAARRDASPAPYYDFRPTIDTVGIYSLVVDGGPPEGVKFDVTAPADVAVPRPGQPLPPFDTPTTDNHRGVEPICTREPDPCPFHDMTLTTALASGKPVVYYVGTPKFCEVGSCGPGLESLIEAQKTFGDKFAIVHAEVYTDDTATKPTPAIDAVGLTYEPALFVTDSSGKIRERLDAVWNTDELTETLQRALS